MDTNITAKLNEAKNVADSFVKQYFETLDKSRYLLSKMFLENAILVWNGYAVAGNDNIEKFFFEMPCSNHNVDTYHAQPIMAPIDDNGKNVLIQATGFVKFPKKVPTPYTQNFVLTSQAEKWKIANACFELHHPVDEPVSDTSDTD